jgi:hypothetical protein
MPALKASSCWKVDLVKSPNPQASRNSQLAIIAQHAEALRMQIATLKIQPADPPGDAAILQRLSAMLSVCTREPPGTPRYAIEVEREQFLRDFGVLSVPKVWKSDGISLVVAAGNFDHTAHVLAKLCPMLVESAMEVVITDNDTRPNIRMLPLHINGLRVVHAKTKAEACNLAVAASHGDGVALLEASPDALPARPPEGIVTLGPSVTNCLERWGVTVKTIEGPQIPPSIAAPRAAWIAAGGLDPALDCGDGLAIADLALRLHRLGMRLRSCGAPCKAADHYPDPALQWNCVARFQANWGHRPPSDFALA